MNLVHLLRNISVDPDRIRYYQHHGLEGSGHSKDGFITGMGEEVPVLSL